MEQVFNVTGPSIFETTNFSSNTTGEAIPNANDIAVVMTILYTMMFIFGVTGNALVIYVIYRNPDMSTATNIFLVNLSVADLFVLLVCMPIGLTELYSKQVWLLGGFMCKFTVFLETGVTNASIITMLAISFERYYAICRPLEVLYTCTKARALKIIMGIWTFSLISASPFFTISYTEYIRFKDNKIKPSCRIPIDTPWKDAYNWGIFIVFFTLPCILLTALYSRICKELLRSRRDMMVNSESSISPIGKRSKKLYAKPQNHGRYRPATENSSVTSNSAVFVSPSGLKSVISGSGFGCQYPKQHSRAIQSRRQVIYMLITVIVFSFSCLLPFRIMTLWLIYSSEEEKNKIGGQAIFVLLHIVRILFYMNSAGNPVLYNMMSTKFREASKRSLGVVCTGGQLMYIGTTGTSGTPSRHQSCRRCESATKAESLEYESMAPLSHTNSHHSSQQVPV